MVLDGVVGMVISSCFCDSSRLRRRRRRRIFFVCVGSCCWVSPGVGSGADGGGDRMFSLVATGLLIFGNDRDLDVLWD